MTDFHERARPPHWNDAVTSTFDEISNLTRSPSCPRCGAPMRLSRLEPHPQGGADDMIYECACGENLTKTVQRR